MNGLSVIIPSKTVSNLVPCLSAIFANEPDIRVFVVDDGLDQTFRESVHFGDPRITMVLGVKPFVFSRNVNLGIQAAGTDSVVILNDDALLETSGGFTAMHECAKAHPEYGVISAACNTVGNLNQHRKGTSGLRNEPRMVCFISALITRAALDRVGKLDEDFVNYGCDDDSYCLEVRNAGLKIGIFDGCFVDHSKLKSTFRGGPNVGGDFRPNLKIFIAKYGVDNHGNDKAHSSWPELFPA